MHDVIGQVRARKSLKCDVTVFLICVLIFVLKGFEINITNFGRTIAYLACVYLQSEDEETVRRNIRRCVEELRWFDIPNLKQSNQRPILITLSLALISIYVSL